MPGHYSEKKYTKAELTQRAVELCKKGGLVSFSDIIAFLPVSRSKFYVTIPSGSKEWKEIDDALQASKRKACVSIRSRLYAMTDNLTAQLAVYRMMCTDEERLNICTNHTDITSNGKEIQAPEPLTVEIIDSTAKVVKNE